MRYTCFDSIDISQNHVNPDLFRNKVAPFTVFFKTRTMFNRLKEQILRSYTVVVRRG